MTRFRIFSVALLAILILFSIGSFAKDHSLDKGATLLKTSTNDDNVPFLINNIFNYYSNNGDASYNMFRANGGFEWPKGSGLTAIYEEGLIWSGYHGAKVAANLKTGGSAYRHGLQAGRITNSGLPYTSLVAANPGDAANHTYRVRPDINPSKTFADVQTILETEEVTLMSRNATTSARELYDAYIADWNNWPASQGAPFDDKNGNGIYESTIDIPGVPGADQTLWHVSNDLDAGRTTYLYGSNPIGLEYQRTIWGYRRDGALGNTVFMRHKIINKSNLPLDSAFFAQWSDPDIGDAADDYVGCDKDLSLGYAYNANNIDAQYGNRPPAVGYDFLQGPIVASAGDSAIFNNKRIHNFKNLEMSAINFFINGNASYTDPTQGNFSGTGQWYNLMNGKIGTTGADYIDPTTNLATKFMFPGDPTTGNGWIEGSLAPPGDRRLCSVTGPFTLLPGDTQEVVIGLIVSQGNDRLSSITTLKHDDALIQATYSSLFTKFSPYVTVATTISSSNSTQTKILANAVGIGATSISVEFKRYTGGTLTTVMLYDDGAHDDGVALDGVFANTVSIPQQSDGLFASATVVYSNGGNVLWDHVVDEISTLGPVQILNPTIVSDALNSDGIVNYGEDIRFTATISNQSSYSLSNVYSSTTAQFVRFGELPGFGTKTTVYDPKDPSTFFSFTTPNFPIGTLNDTVYYTIVLHDFNHNKWEIPVLKFKSVAPAHQPYQAPMTSSNELAGNFEIRIVDPAKIKNHVYVITGVDSINTIKERGFTLVDSTDNNRVVLKNQPLSDVLGHTAPVVEGFKVVRGTVDTITGYKDYGVVGTRRFTWSGGDGYGLEGFNGAMGSALQFWGIGVGNAQLRSVKLKLVAADTANGGTWAAADPNSSAAYRFMRGAQNAAAKPTFAPFIINSTSYGFQDYRPDAVPFSAWDIETTPPTRLAIAILENNVLAGLVDGKWWPPIAGVDNFSLAGAREWFFIMSTPYGAGVNGTDNPAFHTDLVSDPNLPLMWVSLANRRTNVPWAAGDELDIFAWHPITSKDQWSFNPTVVTAGITSSGSVPKNYELSQNFPNPFNPSTMIQYSLPLASTVELKIYNLLGQEIRTLVGTDQPSGVYTVQWDGKSNRGIAIASGVYFYRLTAGSYMKTRKLLLLR